MWCSYQKIQNKKYVRLLLRRKSLSRSKWCKPQVANMYASPIRMSGVHQTHRIFFPNKIENINSHWCFVWKNRHEFMRLIYSHKNDSSWVKKKSYVKRKSTQLIWEKRQKFDDRTQGHRTLSVLIIIQATLWMYF